MNGLLPLHNNSDDASAIERKREGDIQGLSFREQDKREREGEKEKKNPSFCFFSASMLLLLHLFQARKLTAFSRIVIAPRRTRALFWLIPLTTINGEG